MLILWTIITSFCRCTVTSLEAFAYYLAHKFASLSSALVVEWYNYRLPRGWPGFDSRLMQTFAKNYFYENLIFVHSHLGLRYHRCLT